MKKIITVVALLFIIISSFSQNDSIKGSEWNFTVGPYLLVPNMSGNVAIGAAEIEVDADPEDILENLDFAAMLYFEASNADWAITFDLLYMKLGKSGVVPIDRSAEIGLKQLGLTITGLYRVNPWLEAGIGGRINSINQNAKIAPGQGPFQGVDVSDTKTWFDPIFAARASTKIKDGDWKLALSGDIGGFGMGSDLTWQVRPTVGYQFTNVFAMDLSYRWLGIDYKTGAGPNRFLYDMVISGPELGFLFSF